MIAAMLNKGAMERKRIALTGRGGRRCSEVSGDEVRLLAAMQRMTSNTAHDSHIHTERKES